MMRASVAQYRSDRLWWRWKKLPEKEVRNRTRLKTLKTKVEPHPMGQSTLKIRQKWRRWRLASTEKRSVFSAD